MYYSFFLKLMTFQTLSTGEISWDINASATLFGVDKRVLTYLIVKWSSACLHTVMRELQDGHFEMKMLAFSYYYIHVYKRSRWLVMKKFFLTISSCRLFSQLYLYGISKQFLPSSRVLSLPPLVCLLWNCLLLRSLNGAV